MCSGVGLNGVGNSGPYNCPEPDVTRGKAGSLDNDNELSLEVNYYKTKADNCDTYSQNNDNIGRRINTPFVARDIRELMKVINSDGLIRYYGESQSPLDQLNRLAYCTLVHPCNAHT